MWLNPQELADLVTFTEEILNGNFHFLCSVCILGSNLWVLFCDQGRRGIILAALPLPLETVEPVHLNGASSILLSKDSLGTGGNWFFVKKYQGTLQILLLFLVWSPLLYNKFHWPGILKCLKMRRWKCWWVTANLTSTKFSNECSLFVFKYSL